MYKVKQQQKKQRKLTKNVLGEDTTEDCTYKVKGALSGLRQFLAIESPLKMMRNTFCFTSNALCSQDI